ncbi:DUF4129 domain-containing protein [Bacteroides salyersiae]|uniref:DUF4129 domain-containing protein n=1 Tax=Bacteroides salyersiae TaxID=291644 RepID=UPI001C8BCEDE|nr:DUF4129 domain-containing protein [Bacteroides salyersiae]
MTAPADTIVYDSLTVAYWQGQPEYDYNRELITPEFDLIAWLNLWLGKLLQKIFGSTFAEKYTETILVALFVVALLLIVWFIYKKRPELFMRSKRTLPYRVEEDTIYGVDFQKEIDAAVFRNDYREVVRLLYLQTLKFLSDAGKIDWQPYKTPTEYIYEIKIDTLKTPFRELTNRFLRVRYGNFEATVVLYREMQAFQKEMVEGGGV